MDSFEIIVDQTEERFKKTYKLSLKHWLWHDKIIGKTLIILYILCTFLVFISIFLFTLNPHNYVGLIIYLGEAAFGFFAVPWGFKYLLYVKHKEDLKLIVKMRFSQHEYITYHPTHEIKVPYSMFKKLVETDKFLVLYRAHKKQPTIFFPLYIFSNQQLELLKEWINHDINTVI